MALDEENRIAAVDAAAMAETQRLALELLPQSDLLAASVGERVLEVLPDIVPHEVPGALEVVRESTEQNIGAMLATLAFGVAPSAIEPPLGTLKLLRQVVAAGGDATTVLHAYRVGHERLWQVWADHVVPRIGEGVDLAAVLRVSSAHFFAFIDRSCEGLLEEYRREFADAGLSGAPGIGARGDVIDALLGGDPVDLDAARTRLGYDVAGHHVALVLRPIAAESDARGALDMIVAAAAGAAGTGGAPRVLSRPAGDGAWSAWLGWPQAPAAGVRAAVAGCVPTGLVVGLGRDGAGREGFRRSHEQALDAERIARLSRAPRAGVVPVEDVELAGLLCHDRVRAERLAADRLGPLARADEASARLRETLRAYLATGGSKKRTAVVLHVHQKTVTYRLSRVELLLGRPLDGSTADLDAALRIHLTLHGS